MQLPENIESLGRKKNVSAGQQLFSAGELAVGFYYLVSGRARAYSVGEDGKEIEIASFNPGDFMGEAILFSKGHYPVSCEAIKNSTVLYFPQDVMDTALQKDGSVAKYFLYIMANKCLVLSRRVDQLGTKSVRQRLAQYLLSNLAGNQVKLVISKTELARQLGTISETLSRNFRQLQNEKIIQVSGQNIKVLKLSGLKDLT